jgi:hypothetical protein
MTPEIFFAGKPLAYRLFAHVVRMLELIGPVTLRVSRSQIAFRRRRGFAWVWMPDRYLRSPTAPLVLSIALPWHDRSPRWKQVAEPAPGRFMHHLELYDPEELDGEIDAWLRQAWDAAGR